ncbi:hypothetical protein O0I10_001400 [Lichtheimia ornata]|uniref:Uncharacterized protein n=1 Tax=Lichtheimia ornata TaxID=688661 RepID=A0AAD7Y3P9_9FUNG|nr:uncharacterized protein O0I10_001400 [Lichtheimia ornata]KAJ8663223.1 hypothetical protein O0I10_001400 [Lichtheimia ornata]
MTIVFSIKRNRSSSALRSSTSGHDFVPSFQEPAASFLSSKPKSIFSKLVSSSSPSSTILGEHRRRSSITSILQSCFRNTDDHDTFGRQRNNSNGVNAFENDALFERYRYQTQHQRKRSDHRPLFADNNRRTKDNEDDDEDDEDEDDDPPPRVICYQEEEQQRRSILVNRSGHRHTTSLQMPGGSSCLNNNSSIHHHHHQSSSSAIHHRRSKTATHIRHYSHISYISSSNITAHSGDLTAKEFADIAGIRILPDDEISSNSDSNNVQPCCCHEDERDFNRRDSLAHMLEEEQQEQEKSDIPLPATTAHHPTSNSSLYVDEQRGSRFSSSDEYNQTTTADTTTTLPPPPPPATGTTHKPHIWDNAFWRQPHVGGMDNFFTCTKNDAEREAIATTISPESTDKALVPPVVQEMRSRNSTVFKKGRFEVHVESL